MRCAINGEYPFGFNGYEFLKTYASLKYKIDGKEYVSKMFDNKTPGNEKTYLYVSVDKKIIGELTAKRGYPSLQQNMQRGRYSFCLTVKC
jgi:hypothetical protein